MALPLASQTVRLNDGSIATIHPVWNGSQLPLELVAALCVEYNAEIDKGQSFPETHRLMLETFEKSWFSGVSGVVIRGTDKFYLEDFDLLDNNECLGSFWIKPGFPGRSSHICTANFLVRSKFRKSGVGIAMGQCFLRWARQLGYDYALFSLVYDCNVAACKILDRLGFQVLSTLKGAGVLKGFSLPVDAFMFGRSLTSSGTHTPNTPNTPRNLHIPPGSMESTPLEVGNSAQDTLDPSLRSQLSSEFEQMRIYLMEGTYPANTTRTERTRIRSRARSYEVVDGTLLFKRTHARVVTDPKEQERIVTAMHRENHNGINKLQKRVLEAYHWHGVRETIMGVIKRCPECRAASQPRLEDNELGSETSFSDFLSSHDIPKNKPSEQAQLYQSVFTPHLSQDPYNVVYLPPENEDDEYVPEDADFDLGLGQPEQAEDDDDGLHDDDDDDEWTGEFLEDDEDEDDDEEQDIE